ncbi:hypothetical protein J6590_077946 [Homalodisca vitripennis]|nr:hypothetical protein J6590_077946 [Homalodisca vitripennis]
MSLTILDNVLDNGPTSGSTYIRYRHSIAIFKKMIHICLPSRHISDPRDVNAHNQEYYTTHATHNRKDRRLERKNLATSCDVVASDI